MEELAKNSKLKKKIERELFVYKEQLSYWDMEEILGVSQRSYFQYCRELKECRKRIETFENPLSYHYQECTAKGVTEQHMERLCRLMMMIDYINTLPTAPYGIKNVSIEEWKEHIQNLPPRTKQRDFLVLQKIGYRITQREKRYFFQFNDNHFWEQEF